MQQSLCLAGICAAKQRRNLKASWHSLCSHAEVAPRTLMRPKQILVDTYFEEG